MKLKLLLTVLAWDVGCATMRGTEQTVKVATNPPGAKIEFDDEYYGTTPRFVELTRSKNGTITFSKPGYETKTIDLPTSYRWGDSFFANFVFVFWGAPLGWAFDLLTGTAWDFEKINVIKLKPLPGSPLMEDDEMRVTALAIAPPRAKFELLSDEIGNRLEKTARMRYPRYKILPYDETLEMFANYGYLNDEAPSAEFRDDLFKKLKIGYVMESELSRQGDNIHAEIETQEIFTEGKADAFSLNYNANSLNNGGPDTLTRKLLSLVSVIPNTLTFDFTSASVAISASPQDGSAGYLAERDHERNWLTVMGGFGLKKSQSPSLLKKFKFTFSLIPELSFNFRKIQFKRVSGANEFSNLTFSTYSVIMGLGPEFGLECPIGYFYLDFIPNLGPTWIAWTKGGDDHLSRNFGFTMETEAGFMFYISQDLNIRLFARTVGTPGNQWVSVLEEASGRPMKVEEARYSVAGLALGYYFPSGKNTVKKWFR